MFVSHNELVWMLRQVYGRRIRRDDLHRKFSNHGITSLLAYVDGIDTLFDRLDDQSTLINKALPALAARINGDINAGDVTDGGISFAELEAHLLPILMAAIGIEKSSLLEKGARVAVRPDSNSHYVRPGSEGFITEKSDGFSRVRFYCSAGLYNAEMFSAEVPDEELELLTLETLLDRHRDLQGVARYFFNDTMLRAMKPVIDSSIYAFAADAAISFLLNEGYLKAAADEYVGVLDRIFPVLAPRFAAAYADPRLFSSPTLSCPPSERKAHVLRLELTTGCDYNRCTFCSEYTGMSAVTKPFAAFKEHVDHVAATIGPETSRIQRLFIGSGNTLGVETRLLLQCLDYARDSFNPQKISVYGRTISILEKSVAELKQLEEAGLTLIYWGLESGSDEILNYINKNCTQVDMIKAAAKLAAAEIDVSAMLMPGVGGLKFAQQHVDGTRELLHNIRIKYLTLLSINPASSCEYEKNMQAESDNRHLTPAEVNAQVCQLLKDLQPMGFHIGMFTEEIDQASSNTMRFNCQFTEAGKERLLRELGSFAEG